MYFIDSNIILELALEQEKADLVRGFLKKNNLENINVSDLSIHTIGIILFRHQKEEAFVSIIKELIIDGMNIISLPISKYEEVKFNSKKYSLDFEDSYQYTITRIYSLTLVSFDKDFDKTDIKRFELK